MLGFDMETTGVDVMTDVPVSFALAQRDGPILKVVSELVNPGRPIPHEATDIHGIAEWDVTDATPLEEAVPMVADRIIKAGRLGVPVVGTNLAYDLTMLDRLRRQVVGKSLSDDGWWGPVLDVLVLDKHFDQYRPGSRRLDALCHHYEVLMGEAHSSRADAIACLRIVRNMAARYKGLRFRTLDALHHLQKEWHQQQTLSLSEYFVAEGQPPIPDDQYGWPLHFVHAEP
jgi:DNA polymerase-3 subunit epsilon